MAAATVRPARVGRQNGQSQASAKSRQEPNPGRVNVRRGRATSAGCRPRGSSAIDMRSDAAKTDERDWTNSVADAL